MAAKSKGVSPSSCQLPVVWICPQIQTTNFRFNFRFNFRSNFRFNSGGLDLSTSGSTPNPVQTTNPNHQGREPPLEPWPAAKRRKSRRLESKLFPKWGTPLKKKGVWSGFLSIYRYIEPHILPTGLLRLVLVGARFKQAPYQVLTPVLGREMQRRAATPGGRLHISTRLQQAWAAW